MSEFLFDAAGAPKAALLRLLDVLSLSHNGGLVSITNAMQPYYQREQRTGRPLERWELAPIHEDRRGVIMPLLRELGLMDEVKPATTMIGPRDYGIWLGGPLGAMLARLADLAQLWQGGYFNNLVFLASQRRLDPVERDAWVELQYVDRTDDDQNLLTIAPDWRRFGRGYRLSPHAGPQTEYDLMGSLWMISALPTLMKEEFTAIFGSVYHNYVWIDTPLKQDYRRPNTGDTILYWLDHYRPSGRCLAVSDQPCVRRQQAAIEVALRGRGEAITVETVGPAAPTDVPIALCLRELAAWLYNLRKLRGL